MGDLDRVRFGGKIVDRRTSEMLAEAERLAQAQDPSIDDFHLTQGCWHTGVAASAGTHSGPGAFDMYTAKYTPEQKEIIGMALRKVGFASWRRRAIPGKWGEHWHGIAMDTEGLPPVAARQVTSYLNGRDGLRGNGEDPDPRPKEINTWEEYKKERDAAEDRVDTGPAETETAPTRDPYGIDAGATLDRDTDSDGLTDAFEKLAGTSIHSGDSDSDGLSDSYEAVQSHTNPLSSDTDADGQSDTAELAAGTDAGRLPGIGGVIGTGVFAEYFRDVKDADADGLSDHTEKLVGLDPNNADSDADGLTDSVEAALGTDPLLADTDHDGLTDELEVQHGSDPLGTFIDSTGRTVKTAPWTLEAAYARRMAAQQSADQPGNTDPAAGTAVTAAAARDPYAIEPGQPLGQPDPLPGAEAVDADTDRDGLTDAFEKLAGTKVNVADSDADGLSDGYEALKSRTDPLAADTDKDKLADAQEIATGGDAGTIPGVAGVVGTGAFAEHYRDIKDADRDGLSDRAEKLIKTDARKADTDGDKLSDAQEITFGTNPLLADTDRDGVSDAIEVQYGLDPLAPGSVMASSVPGAGMAGPGALPSGASGQPGDPGGDIDPT